MYSSFDDDKMCSTYDTNTIIYSVSCLISVVCKQVNVLTVMVHGQYNMTLIPQIYFYEWKQMWHCITAFARPDCHFTLLPPFPRKLENTLCSFCWYYQYYRPSIFKLSVYNVDARHSCLPLFLVIYLISNILLEFD